MKQIQKDFHSDILELVRSARVSIVHAVNQTMVRTYFEIGRKIVEKEQDGNQRAGYGKEVLKELSVLLTKEFARGFSVTNLRQMRNFFLAYTGRITASEELLVKKQQTVSAIFNLSWSHYLKLMRIDNLEERNFYEIESVKNNWSVRELNRQFDTALYTRLSLSRDKAGIKELSIKGQIIETPKDLIKDPYILEFIGLPEHSKYSESQLEQELVDKLEHFLLELGTGFAFVARQKRISFDEQHFFIDLVFYNRLLKCFVLIDLKIGKLKHQDLGQIQMYVNYYDRVVKLDDENKTIGIVLCQDKAESIVEFTLPENNEQIFASNYGTVLPSKEDLKKLLAQKN